MALTIAARPASISGCVQSWSEADMPQVIRTSMDSGTVKVRRRFTGIHRTANASVTLKAEQYDDFMDWYRTLCMGGVYPTRIITPYGKEEVWRFTEPPQIEWIDAKAFRATLALERLPAWP